jgi:hypothetical protein
MSAPLRFITLLLLAFSVAPVAEAQVTRNYGTIYSRFGLGEPQQFSSSQAVMMGATGVGLRSGVYAGLANPALWSDLQLVHLTFGAEVQGLRAEDATGASTDLFGSNLTGLQVSLPLYEQRVGVTLALRPYTRVNYAAARDGILLAPDLGRDTVLFRVNLEGDGGLYQTLLGIGWRLNERVSIGVNGHLLFGLIEDRQRTTYTTSTTIPETILATRTRMWGVGATVGAVGSAPELFRAGDILNVGAAVTLPTRLDARRDRVTGRSLDVDTLAAQVRGEVIVPLRAAVGFSYVPTPIVTIATDVLYEPWGTFESDLGFGGYQPEAGVDVLRNRLRVGGGIQVTPAGLDRAAPYLARASYRLGAYSDRAFYSPEDQNISATALTGGVSFPGLLPAARFDLGFEVGTRGTTEAGLVRDLFLKGTATLNFGERWFVRRRFG